jgi:plasmid stability protein
MATLSIKNMPDALHRRLKKQASTEGRSLNAELIHLLKQALASQQRMKEWQSRRARLSPRSRMSRTSAWRCFEKTGNAAADAGNTGGCGR